MIFADEIMRETGPDDRQGKETRELLFFQSGEDARYTFSMSIYFLCYASSSSIQLSHSSDRKNICLFRLRSCITLTF